MLNAIKESEAIMTRQEVEELLNRDYDDLEAIKKMTDEQVCEFWNVDSRQDIVDVIEEEIHTLETYDCSDWDDEEHESIYEVNGFANEADYVRYRYC